MVASVAEKYRQIGRSSEKNLKMTKGISGIISRDLKKKKKDEELGPVITKKLHESIQKLDFLI